MAEIKDLMRGVVCDALNDFIASKGGESVAADKIVVQTTPNPEMGDLGVPLDHDLIDVLPAVLGHREHSEGVCCDIGDLHRPESGGVAAVQLGCDGSSLGDRQVSVAVGDDLASGKVPEEPGD